MSIGQGISNQKTLCPASTILIWKSTLTCLDLLAISYLNTKASYSKEP